MSQGFGREVPAQHVQPIHREVTKYLVIIHGADGPIARLFLSSRELATELDANTEEVAAMIKGMAPTIGATGREWDKSLAGQSPEERAAAEVYTLAL